MTGQDQTVLAMGLGYALLGVVLLVILLFARFDWRLKAVLIVLVSGFYVVDFRAARALLGWASPEALPPKFKLLGARIVEPHSLAGDAGAIFLWVEEVDNDNFPSGDPRLFRLRYDAKLAERAEAAAPVEEASAETPAAPAEGAPAVNEPHRFLVPGVKQEEEIHIVTGSWEAGAPPAPPEPPQTEIFQRGQFMFNRRFFETKFSGFFGIVRREADKDKVLQVKTPHALFVAERISRIAANEVHFEVLRGDSRQELMVPFAEIQEIQLKHKKP